MNTRGWSDAYSAYQFLYLGNFYDDNLTDSISVTGLSNGQGAYYFIDDIWLSTDSTILSLIDYQPDKFYLYPNPSKDIIHIVVSENTSFQCFSATGMLIQTFNTIQGNNSLTIDHLASGLYYFINKTGDIKPTKFIKL